MQNNLSLNCCSRGNKFVLLSLHFFWFYLCYISKATTKKLKFPKGKTRLWHLFDKYKKNNFYKRYLTFCISLHPLLSNLFPFSSSSSCFGRRRETEIDYWSLFYLYFEIYFSDNKINIQVSRLIDEQCIFHQIKYLQGHQANLDTTLN